MEGYAFGDDELRELIEAVDQEEEGEQSASEHER
jgi:hypothetical protein